MNENNENNNHAVVRYCVRTPDEAADDDDVLHLHHADPGRLALGPQRDGQHVRGVPAVMVVPW